MLLSMGKTDVMSNVPAPTAMGVVTVSSRLSMNGT
jgi:hypothetical protein